MELHEGVGEVGAQASELAADEKIEMTAGPDAPPAGWRLFLRGAFQGVLASNVLVLPIALLFNTLAWGLTGLFLGVVMWAVVWLPYSLLFSAIPAGLLSWYLSRKNPEGGTQIWIARIGGVLGAILQPIVMINIGIGQFGPGAFPGIPIYFGA